MKHAQTLKDFAVKNFDILAAEIVKSGARKNKITPKKVVSWVRGNAEARQWAVSEGVRGL